VDDRHQIAQPLSLGLRKRQRLDVGGDAFLAARDPEQPRIKVRLPVPSQLEFDEGRVESLTVRLLGVRQGSVHVENQRLQPFHRGISHRLREQVSIRRMREL